MKQSYIVNYRNEDELLELQAREPVFVTNGLCEPVWGSPRLFKRLGLDFHPDKAGGNRGLGYHWGNAHPLNKMEMVYIDCDSVDGPYGGIEMGYSALYQGEKWLAPMIEICYLNAGTFSPESYEGTALETSAMALERAKNIMQNLASNLRGYGGHVKVIEGFDSDRHLVVLLFPMALPDEVGATSWSSWQQFVVSVVNNL